MLFLTRFFLTLLIGALLGVSAGARAGETIHLRVAELPDKRHVYYTKLLEESLAALGYKVRYTFVKDVSQPRIWKMVESDQLSFIWGVQTKNRDAEYAFAVNSLTNGLIGQRLMLIPKGQEQAYAKVNSLEDLRRLDKMGSVGINWLEAELWAINRLPVYTKSGDWRELFPMVRSGARGIDYVVRGANEITIEAAHYGLAVEPRLMLTYDRDMRYYLSPATARYKALFEKALAQADRSGLKKELIARYIGQDLKGLNLDKRVRLKLAMPPS
ncbi:MAG: hypothetical protein ABIT83_13885 [Massilia sp.]